MAENGHELIRGTRHRFGVAGDGSMAARSQKLDVALGFYAVLHPRENARQATDEAQAEIIADHTEARRQCGELVL